MPRFRNRPVAKGSAAGRLKMEIGDAEVSCLAPRIICKPHGSNRAVKAFKKLCSSLGLVYQAVTEEGIEFFVFAPETKEEFFQTAWQRIETVADSACVQSYFFPTTASYPGSFSPMDTRNPFDQHGGREGKRLLLKKRGTETRAQADTLQGRYIPGKVLNDNQELAEFGQAWFPKQDVEPRSIPGPGDKVITATAVPLPLPPANPQPPERDAFGDVV